MILKFVSSKDIFAMQKIADFVNSVINNYHIDSFLIKNVQGRLGKEMKADNL